MPFNSFQIVGFSEKMETLLLAVRPVTLLLVILGASVLVPVFTVGFEKLRNLTNGPMGEVLLGVCLLCHGLVLASWWIPAWYLR